MNFGSRGWLEFPCLSAVTHKEYWVELDSGAVLPGDVTIMVSSSDLTELKAIDDAD